MNLEKIKNFGKNLLSGNLQQNQKIFITISIGWVIFIGYLTWWNGLRNPGIDKGFRWDEWFWFGIVPAFAPYLFFFIWKKSNSEQQ
tara:strand:+ start:1080 stop:1337 length:258 start_codon:yes stop_codon:yes gene_type:complete